MNNKEYRDFQDEYIQFMKLYEVEPIETYVNTKSYRDSYWVANKNKCEELRNLARSLNWSICDLQEQVETLRGVVDKLRLDRASQESSEKSIKE